MDLNLVGKMNTLKDYIGKKDKDLKKPLNDRLLGF